ncbi:peptidyl-prolyl cis-trans isomerase SurA [Brevibacterium sanguinis]|uniref:peptidylprolyl isomerase n=2 Tax=Brevibacterium TaxID=1696 RepID=A0A366IHG0_9MICO|nr:peptidyl-prolyl cis-trans isomerase SurA [Brevibacterium sanguinis]RBP71292.1 peptidyl-prolyl cis-trans isomerase SurA [Brevibacterium celere]
MSGVDVQKIKWWAGLALAASMVAVAACGASAQKDGGSAEETSPAASSEQGQSDAQGGKDQPGAQGQPDVSGIPDVVAVVNGTKITKDEFVPLFQTQFQQMSMQAQQSGQPVDEKQLKTQTAENMVSTELLSQEAEKRGISISDKEVDKGLKEAAESSQMSEKDFLAAMKQQGLDEAAVDSQLKTQLGIEALIADEYGEFKVSDEEVGAAYQQAKTQQEQMGAQSGQGGQMPPLEDVRPQLEEQVKSQKSTEATQEYAGKLRKEADVTINV